MATDKTLQNLQRRLEKWELEHLRKLAAELSERLERTEEALQSARDEIAHAWECAENWQRDVMNLQQELWDAGREIGLTQDGALVVTTPLETEPFEPAIHRAADLLTCIGRQAGRRVVVIGRFTGWGQVSGLRNDVYGATGMAAQRDLGCIDAPNGIAGGPIEVEDSGETGDRYVTERTAFRSIQ